MNPKAQLILIPTPIEEESPLESKALELLDKAYEYRREQSIFAVEDAKPGRRRWIRYGLPRKAIESFTLFNEHTQKELVPELVAQMKKGQKVYLMSDGGLPAFCDPGRELVCAAHEAGLIVSMTPFANSSLAALVLSGFASEPFVFQGFLAKKGKERTQALETLAATSMTQVVMETPYRLKRFLEELSEHPKLSQRRLAVALEINSREEEVHIGNARALLQRLGAQKRPFVLVVDQVLS